MELGHSGVDGAGDMSEHHAIRLAYAAGLVMPLSVPVTLSLVRAASPRCNQPAVSGGAPCRQEEGQAVHGQLVLKTPHDRGQFFI